MNRLGFFLLISLLLHLAGFGIVSRVSLRVPEKAETGPLRVRLVVSAKGNAFQEPAGVKNEEAPVQKEQTKHDVPKEAAKPEKTRKDAGIIPLETGDNAVTEPLEKESRKSLKPKEPAETEKRREPAKSGAPEVFSQGQAGADPQKFPAKSVAKKDKNSLSREGEKDELVPGSAKNGNEKKETGDIAAESGAGGENRTPAVFPVVTEDLIVEKIMPVYPLTARRRGEQGKVLLRVFLSDAGTVKKLSVEESSGFDTLDKAALQAVGRWLFSPKAPPAVLVPVSFRLQ
ncbi:MAG: energy transducer TonB [Thermovirgaceae bacterium]